MPEPTATAADTPRAALAVRSEHTGAFLRLEQWWRHGKAFGLVLAVVDNDDYRDALIAKLDDAFEGERVDIAEVMSPLD